VSLTTAAACSSGGGTATPVTTEGAAPRGSAATSTTEAAAATTPDAAPTSPAVVIPRSVLGADAVSSAPRIDADAADAGLLEECPSIGRRRARHTAVRRERVLLTPASAPLPTVLDDLTEFADGNAAADLFNAAAGNAMLRCLPKIVARSGLELEGVTVTRVPVIEVGDAAAAIRLRGTSFVADLATQVTVELIVVQRGPFLHVVVVTASDLYWLTASQRRAVVAAAGA
jgi:hypothetical protein